MSQSNKRKTNNTRRKRNNRPRKNTGRTRSGRPGQQVFVTPIANQPMITRSLRYSFDDTSTQVVVSSQDLLRMFGAVTNTATTYYSLIESVKLMSVGMTLLANSSTGCASAYLQWLGPNAPTEKLVLYGAQGVPAKDTFVPPSDASCGWWYDQSSTSVSLFAIDVLGITAESVLFVDLHFIYVQADGTVTNSALGTASTFTGIGYRHLGNAAFPAGLAPVGLNEVH